MKNGMEFNFNFKLLLSKSMTKLLLHMLVVLIVSYTGLLGYVILTDAEEFPFGFFLERLTYIYLGSAAISTAMWFFSKRSNKNGEFIQNYISFIWIIALLMVYGLFNELL